MIAYFAFMLFDCHTTEVPHIKDTLFSQWIRLKKKEAISILKLHTVIVLWFYN